MGFLNCPSCAKRLRVPDSLAPMELRCPACRRAFRSGDAAPARQAPAPAGMDAEEDSLSPSTDETSGRILSQADEAMLRDCGAGSGLLELSPEAFTASRAHPPSAATDSRTAPNSHSATNSRSTADSSAADSPEAIAPPPAQPKEEPDRQFQIVGTALTLADKLAAAHRSELRRTRRQAALGWALVAVVTAAAGLAGWWGMTQAGQVQFERQRIAGLAEKLGEANARLAEVKGDLSRLTAELATARGEQQTIQAELSTARNEQRAQATDLAALRESLAEKKGAADALAAELKAAGARLDALAIESNRLEGDLVAARAARAPPADGNAAGAAIPPEARKTWLTTQPATAPAARTAARPAMPIFPPPPLGSPAGNRLRE